MLVHGNWSAWISVDGKELPQYLMTVTEEVLKPPHPQKTWKVSCWIASEESKEFTIHVKMQADSPAVDTAAHVYMDGEAVRGGGVLSGMRIAQDLNITGHLSSGGKYERPFIFSRLALTDDDSASRNIPRLKDLGTIHIRMSRVKCTGTARQSFRKYDGLLVNEPVHETSKKAGAHRVSLGEARHVDGPRCRVDVSYLDKCPFLIFEFCYRPADILRAQDIMLPPSTPSQDAAVRSSKHLIGDRPVVSPGSSTLKPKVTTESSDINDVDEEIRILRTKLRKLEKKRIRPQECLPARPSKKAKAESLDFSKFVDGEIIDLT